MKKIWTKFVNYIKTVILPIFMNIQWLEIPVATYVRWILAVLLSLNTVLTVFGINPIPFSEHIIYEIVSIILNVGILIVNTYKNNSTSKEALIADKIMKALKAASTSTEETAIGKLQDILKELNGEEYTSSSSTDSSEEIENSDNNQE